jgi:lysozyme
MQHLQQWIKNYEKIQLEPYIDTAGKLTIGIGRNLSDCGIRLDEAELMFQNDLKQTIGELEPLSWFSSQPQGVQNALINMNFNLGITKLLEFKEMITALENKNYSAAAQAVLNSIWAKQVHQRAKDIAVAISAGV